MNGSNADPPQNIMAVTLRVEKSEEKHISTVFTKDELVALCLVSNKNRHKNDQLSQYHVC